MFKVFEKITLIFKKIKVLILRRLYSPLQKPSNTCVYQNDQIRMRTLSAAEILETSRKNREGAVYSCILLPDGVDDQLKDSDTLLGQDLDSPLEFWDYDYLQVFENKNSLKNGGIPLCVGPSEENIIKQTDAFYCSEEKCWFWPYQCNANLNEIYPFLPKAYQMGEDTILIPNLVPEPLWGENLRKYLRKEDWDFLRKHTYAQSSYRCLICGGKGERWPVECDEVWEYRLLEDGRGMAVLIGLRALCPRCHRVNHLGKANVDGYYNETIKHMAYINGWSLKRAEQTAEEAFRIFNERSQKNWLLAYDDECNWNPSVEGVLKTFFCETAVPCLGD